MRKSKIINWNGKDVTCKELTVSEISELMESDQEPTILDRVFYDRVPVIAVTIATGLAYEELQACSPSRLEELWGAVEEVNPFFVEMINRLAALEKNQT